MDQGKRKLWANSDVHSRINYLYQVSDLLMRIQNGRERGSQSYFGHLISSIREKNQIKCSVWLKRVMCKKCHTIILGSSARVRHKSKGHKNKYTVVVCRKCKYLKRFPTKVDAHERDTSLPVDSEENVLKEKLAHSQVATLQQDVTAEHKRDAK